MGKINQGILGGFSGKVGTVVGSSWKGIAYMRARTSNRKQVRTAKQLAQQKKFSAIVGFLRPMKAYIQVGYKNYTQGQTAYNAATSYISKNAFSGEHPDVALNYAAVLVSRGSLQPVADAVASAVKGKVKFTWTDNSGFSEASATDLAMPLIYNAERGEAVFDLTAASRAEEEVSISIPSAWTNYTLHLYLGFMSAESASVANSVYLGTVTAI